jgi:antitoxin (DNA-binding transcriptional repressor) of toxin-antitoxin stability system
MELMNLRTARTSLNRLVEGWRGTAGKPVFIGPYGTTEAVIAPLAVWRRLVALAAASWDAETAALRAARLDDPVGPQPLTLRELSREAGCETPPVPLLESRGVPRGGADLAVWGQARDDVRKLPIVATPATAAAVVRVLGELLQGKACTKDSKCGQGTVYTVADVDGLHAAVVTTRTTPRPPGRRSGGAHETVELVAVDQITW